MSSGSGSKVCSRCGEERPLTQFGQSHYTKPRKRTYHHRVCVVCKDEISERKATKEELRTLRAFGIVPDRERVDGPSSTERQPGESFTKECSECREVKAVQEFAWRNKAERSRRPRCRQCEQQARRRRRERLGDDEYRRQNREAQRRHRSEKWRAKDHEAARVQRRAHARASAELRERHREEFDRLYAQAKELESALADEEIE